MLKATRTTLAIASLLAVTLLFVDVTGTARQYWPWMADIQLIPAILSANFIALAFLLILTVLFGRLYCSVICPMGIFQDVIIRIRRWFGGKKARYRFGYDKPRTKTRLIVLFVFALLLVLGLVTVLADAFAGLIEPYSAYGRMASQLMAPGVDAVNNSLAASQADIAGHSFLPVFWRFSLPVFVIAAVTFMVILVFSIIGGRDYCNRICPVGTLLGYLSKISLFRIKIDVSKCNGCRKCERSCKAKCIDFKNHTIDVTRCVVCFDCIDQCSGEAISFGYAFGHKTPGKYDPKLANERIREAKANEKSKKEAGERRHKADENISRGRRGFLLSLSALGGALAAQAAEHGDGALAPVKDKKPVPDAAPVTPPGSGGSVSLESACTACQLCVHNCPNNVLVAGTSLEHFMQPHSDYSKGWCRPECNICGEVCPVGAIRPVTVEEKSSIKIGNAVVDLKRCISAAYGQACGNCSRKCPTGAITMEPVSDAPGANLMPVVAEDICIGCGACQYNCPVGTSEFIHDDYPAIYVSGLRKHIEI